MAQPIEVILERPASKDGRPAAPISIALVITDLDIGGAEKAMVALARGLDQTRWAPHVVCLSGGGALTEFLRAARIPVTCLNARRTSPIEAVGRLRKALEQIQPQLIQSFLFHANVASRLAAARIRPPVPVIGGIRVAERQRRWHLRLERMTQRLGLGWVCVSDSVREFSIATARLDPKRLLVIPNGIDAEPFDKVTPAPRGKLAESADAPLALFVGRLDVQKGVDTLLDAMRLILRRKEHVSLALAGGGPLRPMIQDQMDQDSMLSTHVRMLGRRDDIPALLKACDFLVLPSRWEGMPNVVLEAMAAGKAVIASDVDGTREIEFEGWRVPPDDANALARAIEEAASSRETLASLGQLNRARVAERHLQSAVVQRYEALWLRVLGYGAVGPT